LNCRFHIRIDYRNATLTGIPQHLIRRLQSVINAAARLIHSASRNQHITPLLRQLHWLKAQERINFKLAVLVFKCLHGMAPPYLADEFVRPADSEARRRLRSASSPLLVVRRTHLSTVGDRAFPLAAARLWNSLSRHVTSMTSLPAFKSRPSARAVTCHFGNFNLFCYYYYVYLESFSSYPRFFTRYLHESRD
jgi:hypothetical protein